MKKGNIMFDDGAINHAQITYNIVSGNRTYGVFLDESEALEFGYSIKDRDQQITMQTVKKLK